MEIDARTKTETRESGTVGAVLRARREDRGLSIQQVADSLRIRPDYLRALEEGRFQEIPSALFVTGYLRAYANELGLPPEELSSQYRQTFGTPQPENRKPEKLISTILFAPRRTGRPWISVAVASVVLLGIAWWFRGEITDDALEQPHTPSGISAPRDELTSAPEQHPSPEGGQRTTAASVGSVGLPDTATAAEGVSGGGTAVFPEQVVEIMARDIAWFSVRVDGNHEREFLLKAGDTTRVTGRVVHLKLGNAGGMDVSVDGRPLGPLGSPGQVVSLSIPQDLPRNPKRSAEDE